MTHEHDPLRALIEAEREDVAPSEASKSVTRARIEASIEAGVAPPIDLPPSATSAVLAGSKVVWWLGALVLIGTVAVIGLTREAPQPIAEAPPIERPAPRPTTGATIAVAAPDVPRARPAPKKERRRRKPVVEEKPSAGGLAEELVLMRRAQRAMADDRPADALAPLAEHRDRFAKGVLREEREALTIIALCRLGKTADADARMTAFERAFPKSPQTERIRSECFASLQ